jgi:hypothetical protein
LELCCVPGKTKLLTDVPEEHIMRAKQHIHAVSFPVPQYPQQLQKPNIDGKL